MFKWRTGAAQNWKKKSMKNENKINELKINFTPCSTERSMTITYTIFFFFFWKSNLQVIGFAKVHECDLCYFNLIYHYFNPATVSCALVLALSQHYKITRLINFYWSEKRLTFWKLQLKHLSMNQNMYCKSRKKYKSVIQELEWRPCPPRILNERAFGIQSFPFCNNPAATLTTK